MNESDIQKQILEFLKDQNRPFSANDIFSNVLPDTGKTAKTRALDMLISEDKVKEKIYGKQKVYYVNQDIFGDSSNEDLQMLDITINELSNTYRAMESTVKKLEGTHEDLNSYLPTDKAKQELTNVTSSISILGDKLKILQTEYANFDASKSKNLLADKEKHVKAYRNRKRMANNIIDAILEGYPNSKNQLIEEIGIETSEDDKKL